MIDTTGKDPLPLAARQAAEQTAADRRRLLQAASSIATDTSSTALVVIADALEAWVNQAGSGVDRQHRLSLISQHSWNFKAAKRVPSPETDLLNATLKAFRAAGEDHLLVDHLATKAGVSKKELAARLQKLDIRPVEVRVTEGLISKRQVTRKAYTRSSVTDAQSRIATGDLDVLAPTQIAEAFLAEVRDLHGYLTR